MDLIDIGPVFDAAGYAEVNRNIVLHLYQLGVNVRVKPVPLGCTRVNLDPDTRAVLEKMVHNAYVNAGLALFVFLGGFLEREPGCHSIGLTMLETDRIPPDWVARCNLMDEIWVPSRFNRETFISSGVDEAKVRVMPLGVDGKRFHPGVPPISIPGRKGFAFLSVFEWVFRKGYDILLRAYLAEFRPDEDVCLVLKVHDNSSYDPSGSRIRAEISALQQAIGREAGPPVIVLPELMTPGDMPRLYSAADCFVLPTRGEGWNMPAIEAMACGVPAICTGWSSHLEFMTRDNSLLIDVDGLDPVPALGIPNDRVYAGSRWARPSEAHLRSLMRWAYEHREHARDVGRRGCRDVLERFVWEKAVRPMYARLLEIDAVVQEQRRGACQAAAGAGSHAGGPQPASPAQPAPPGPPPIPGPGENWRLARRWKPEHGPVRKLDVSGGRQVFETLRRSARRLPEDAEPGVAHSGQSLLHPKDIRPLLQTVRRSGWKAVPCSPPAAFGSDRHDATGRVIPKDPGWRGNPGEASPDPHAHGGPSGSAQGALDSNARAGNRSGNPGSSSIQGQRVARVVMVVPSWGRPCGISEYSKALIEHLADCGIEGTIVTSASLDDILPLIETACHRTRSGVAGSLRFGTHGSAQDQTPGAIVHFQYEFVLYDMADLSSTVAALREAGVPVIATAHDFAPGFVRSGEFVARAFSHLIVHSREARAEYCRVGADPAQTTVIPMGCRTHTFDGQTPVIEARPAVGFFGFCLPHKGIIELAVAVREVRRVYPGLKCFVLSSIAPYHASRTFAARLCDTLAGLGVSDDVTIISDYLPETEVVAFLRSMDVNVLPYRDHGLIGTSAAARTVMSAERPMIVTDVPFFSDLGAEVYKIPSAHPDEIARALLRLLGDPGLRAELVQRMQCFLRRNHWSVVARRHAELYVRILQESVVTRVDGSAGLARQAAAETTRKSTEKAGEEIEDGTAAGHGESEVQPHVS